MSFLNKSWLIIILFWNFKTYRDIKSSIQYWHIILKIYSVMCISFPAKGHQDKGPELGISRDFSKCQIIFFKDNKQFGSQTIMTSLEWIFFLLMAKLKLSAYFRAVPDATEFQCLRMKLDTSQDLLLDLPVLLVFYFTKEPSELKKKKKKRQNKQNKTQLL